MRTDRMQRVNMMMDLSTLTAVDGLITEIQRKGGKSLSRSEVVRAVCRAVEESLRRLEMGLPVLASGEELREALADWMIEAEQASQELARTHASTTARRKP